MQSKIILLLGIIAHTTCTSNSMTMKSILLAFDSSADVEYMKILMEHNTRPVVSPDDTKQHERNKTLAVIDKRSIQEDKKKLMLESAAEKGKDNRDDLETAAGTNILRPLFVYRQQVAYRQRIRKAGRRAVPNL